MPNIANIYSQVLTSGSGSARERQTLMEYGTHIASADSDSTHYERLSRDHRKAMLVSCKNWLYNNKAIYFYVNPSEVQWPISRRGSFTKTATGTVRNVWRNRYRNTYFDEFPLKITFQGGNIMPGMPWFASPPTNAADANRALDTPIVPYGLNNLYDFLELIDQPVLSGQYENLHVLVHSSRVFPRIRLEGYFTDDAVTINESAKNNGNTVTWDATFMVYRTYPKLSNAKLLRQVWQGWAHREMGAEILPAHIRQKYGVGEFAPIRRSEDTAVRTSSTQQSNTLPPNPRDPDRSQQQHNNLRNSPPAQTGEVVVPGDPTNDPMIQFGL